MVGEGGAVPSEGLGAANRAAELWAVAEEKAVSVEDLGRAVKVKACAAVSQVVVVAGSAAGAMGLEESTGEAAGEVGGWVAAERQGRQR